MKSIKRLFSKGSIAYCAHMTYLEHVGHAFVYHIGPSFYKNLELFEQLFTGIKAIFNLILLLFIMLISPLFCWYSGYRNLMYSRKRFQEHDGIYVGKFDKLNKYKENDEK